jgi:hypothetical protein
MPNKLNQLFNAMSFGNVGNLTEFLRLLERHAEIPCKGEGTTRLKDEWDDAFPDRSPFVSNGICSH